MKPVEQRVYLIVKIEDELPKTSKYLVLKENGDKDFVYTPFSKDVTHWLKPQEVFVFTKEQLNEYTRNVGKVFLDNAAESICIKIFGKLWKAYSFESGTKVLDRVNIEVYKQSITNTFEETFKKFEV